MIKSRFQTWERVDQFLKCKVHKNQGYKLKECLEFEWVNYILYILLLYSPILETRQSFEQKREGHSAEQDEQYLLLNLELQYIQGYQIVHFLNTSNFYEKSSFKIFLKNFAETQHEDFSRKSWYSQSIIFW